MRVSEHEANARNGHPELSAVAAHSWEGHKIKRQAEVLDKEKSGIERKAKESFWIRKHGDNVMNLDGVMMLANCGVVCSRDC